MRTALAQNAPARTDPVQLYPSKDFPRQPGFQPSCLRVCNPTGSAATYRVYVDVIADEEMGVSVPSDACIIRDDTSLAAGADSSIENGLSIGPTGCIWVAAGTANSICFTLEGSSV